MMPADVHGTALVVGEAGILIRGPARSGKSALAWSALRRAELLGRPARLVADDRVVLSLRGSSVVAAAPPSIAGLIELSGVGILRVPFAAEAPLTLLVTLAEAGAAPRLPETGTEDVLGVPVRRIYLPAREASFGADVLHGLVMTDGGTSLTKS